MSEYFFKEERNSRQAFFAAFCKDKSLLLHTLARGREKETRNFVLFYWYWIVRISMLCGATHIIGIICIRKLNFRNSTLHYHTTKIELNKCFPWIYSKVANIKNVKNAGYTLLLLSFWCRELIHYASIHYTVENILKTNKLLNSRVTLCIEYYKLFTKFIRERYIFISWF